MCWTPDDDLIPDDPLWDVTEDDKNQGDGDLPSPEDLLEDDDYDYDLDADDKYKDPYELEF